MKHRKNWKKRLAAFLMVSMVLSIMCVSAFAADAAQPAIDTAAINAAFITGFNGMVVNSISMISAMVPIALTLAGVLFVVRKCMGWFKAIGK